MCFMNDASYFEIVWILKKKCSFLFSHTVTSDEPIQWFIGVYFNVCLTSLALLYNFIIYIDAHISDLFDFCSTENLSILSTERYPSKIKIWHIHSGKTCLVASFLWKAKYNWKCMMPCCRTNSEFPSLSKIFKKWMSRCHYYINREHFSWIKQLQK